MKFYHHKRRAAPAIIIISLIDILIVVLIFLMVTTTFKQTPAVKLTLPESNQPRQGATSDAMMVVTVAKAEPHFYMDTRPVTLVRLQEELNARGAKNPQLVLSIRADTDAPFGEIIKVMDAAKTAKIKAISAFTRQPGQR